ncbi:MAG TPA: DUF2155 domain-containing protein [Patescibacteria group bacterium]|nr:DUF2155 domain-containing protein [Patescibacteria group bacterium]
MRILFSLLALGLVLAPLQAEAAPRKMEDMQIVVMRTIDKLSARTHTFEIPVDKTVKFGNSLFIKVRACRRASPLDRPESAAFMQVWERKPSEEESKWIFSGWMFASNPSISSMDHPVYDAWVMECKNAATVAKSAEVFSSEKAPAHAPEKDGVASKPLTAATPAAEDEEEDTEASPDTDEEERAVDQSAIKPRAKPVPSLLKPTPRPAPVPGEETPAKPSPMPPVDQLPGSFEDGGADTEASPEETTED